jgi:hypothetical protein
MQVGPRRRRGPGRCAAFGEHREKQRQHPGDPRARGAHDEGTAQAQQLDEHETAQERANDGPHGVRRVQPPERPAQVLRATAEVPRQGREGRAHHHRGRSHRQQREAEPDQRQHLGLILERAVGPAVDLVEQAERDRRGQDDEDQGHFQPAVEAQWRADAVGQAPANHAPDGHPAEEAGEDGRHGLGRVAEHQHELAGPHDLVDESRGAGQDEDGEDGGPAHRGGHRRAMLTASTQQPGSRAKCTGAATSTAVARMTHRRGNPGAVSS